LDFQVERVQLKELDAKGSKQVTTKQKQKQTKNPWYLLFKRAFISAEQVAWLYQAENLGFPQSDDILPGLLRYATAVISYSYC
jgi:hypothetical protein